MCGIRKIMVVICICILAACGHKSENIFLEKDGKLYEVGDQVSFYYPKEFKVDSSNNKEFLRFIDDQEILHYATLLDDTDNNVEDLPELYAGQLDEDGAENVHYTHITLESGIKCQEFTGTYTATGVHFKHVVYFTDTKTYVYSYEAPKDVYNDHIDIMTQYLESLTVHHENVSNLD